MIYIASPYTNEHTAVVEDRYERVMAFTAQKANEGHIVFSPIVHCHEMAKNHKLPTDHIFWGKQNIGMLRVCEALWVLKLKGWNKSSGVIQEIKWARQLGIPVTYFDE